MGNRSGSKLIFAVAVLYPLVPSPTSGSKALSIPSSTFAASTTADQMGRGVHAFEKRNFESGLAAPFEIDRSAAGIILRETVAAPGDLAYVSDTPFSSLFMSYVFTFRGPSTIVEPFLVNVTAAGLAGYSVNLAPASPRDVNSGKVFFAYRAQGKTERFIEGRMRSEPYAYQLGHSYRVDTIADPGSRVFSVRVYDVALGPQAFDASLTFFERGAKVYPGIINRLGGNIDVRDLTFGSVEEPPVTAHIARPAFDYHSYLGYNANLAGTSSGAVRGFLNYFPALGILHVRVPDDPSVLPILNAVAKDGVTADVLTGRSSTVARLGDFISRLAAPPDAIELWNEPNNTSEGAAYDSDYLADLPTFARAVHQAFPNVTLFGPSILPDHDAYPTVQQKLAGTVGPLVSAWNAHAYALQKPEGTGYGGYISSACGPGFGEDCGWYGSPLWNDRESAVLNPALPGVTTEGAASYGSYPGICGHSNVSLSAQQAYVERGLLYDFKLGHLRNYPYKLIDDGGCSDGFGTYGILSKLVDRGGSVRIAPKPAYTSLVYLDRLLFGSGVATTKPAALDFAIAPARADIEDLVLREADGTFRLVLWSDDALWDFNANGLTAAGAEVPRRSTLETLHFGRPVSSIAYMQQPGSGRWTQRAANDRASSITVAIDQYPMVLVIDPDHRLKARDRRALLATGVPTPGPVETPAARPGP